MNLNQMKPKRQQEEQIKENGENPYKMQTVEALEKKANEDDVRKVKIYGSLFLALAMTFVALLMFLFFILGS